MLFHERLKATRKIRNLTQKQVATLCNVSERYYQQLEYGKALPGCEILIQLSKSLNVSTDYLLFIKDNMDI